MTALVSTRATVTWVFAAPLTNRETERLQDALAAIYPDVGWMAEFCRPEYKCLPCDGHGDIVKRHFRKQGGAGALRCRYCRGTGWRNGVYPL